MTNQPTTALADALRVRRTQQQMTQAQLAELLGVTQSAVAQWERGTVTPGLSRLRDLADALEVAPAALLELVP
jgi:transcriptional regulator with XRE-family HTH domain